MGQAQPKGREMQYFYDVLNWDNANGVWVSAQYGYQYAYPSAHEIMNVFGQAGWRVVGIGNIHGDAVDEIVLEYSYTNVVAQNAYPPAQ